MTERNSHFEQGQIALTQHQPERAFQHYSQGAKKGETLCFAMLAQCYALGLGINMDIDRALSWYKKAWKHHQDTDICVEIARLYLSDGNGRQAIYWWEKAIELGDVVATFDYIQYLMIKKKGKSEVLTWRLISKVLNHTSLDDAQRNEIFSFIRLLSDC